VKATERKKIERFISLSDDVCVILDRLSETLRDDDLYVLSSHVAETMHRLAALVTDSSQPASQA
jgi:hypothetical protein